MKFGILLVMVITVLSGSYHLQAQHVTDDSAAYTPIPIPTVKEKKSKIREAVESADVNKRISYFFSLQSGTLIGCRHCGEASGVSSTSSVINGITINKKIRAGIGLGFDSYTGWKTLPAYISLGYDLLGDKNRNAFFVQFNYGLSKAWLLTAFKGYSFERSEGGRMFAPQVGYRIKYHDLNLSFSLGAKFQRVFAYYAYPTTVWFNGDYRPSTSNTTIKQDMIRLMVTMAVGF
jgi:hypothetical protein